MNNLQKFSILLFILTIFLAISLSRRADEAKRKDKLAQDIQYVNNEYDDCLYFSTFRFIGAGVLLNYQKDNKYLIEEDYANSLNYIEFLKNKNDKKCLNEKEAKLKELGTK